MPLMPTSQAAQRLLVLLMMSFFVAAPACAVEPDEILKDPALEARARHISLQLRCLVCQNQSIDDSNAPLARDLRLLVRERLVAGDTDEGVKSFLVQRYGEFVLLKPPLGYNTLLLWLTPILVLLVAGGWMVRRLMCGAGPTPSGNDAPLTKEEQARLDALLDQDRPSSQR